MKLQDTIWPSEGRAVEIACQPIEHSHVAMEMAH